MFCPQCGAKQSDELKFCNLCGANLSAVRQVVSARGAEDERQTAELERERGVTAEVKRYNEIKAGVITSFVGAGVSVFLFFFMEGVVRSGQNPPSEEPILRAIWIAGLIPFMVGLALIVNGLFVSKKLVEIERRESQPAPDALKKGKGEGQPALRSADTSEFIPTDFSVTEGTTKHLRVPDRKP